MIREIITPQKTEVNITIPHSYLYQEVEFIAFPINQKTNKNKNNINSLAGSLHKYANKSKQSLEDSAFVDAMVKKYQ